MQGQIHLGNVEQTANKHHKNENVNEERSSFELTRDNSGKPTTMIATEGENESTGGDTPTNIPPGETVAGVKEDLENLYSEITSTGQPGKDTAGGGKSKNAYNDLISPREPSDGASLGQAGGGQGMAWVPPQEVLYDQPVR